MEDFEQLRGIALRGPQSEVHVRYARAARHAASSRAQQAAELAAAARKKHRGLFAGLNPARG